MRKIISEKLKALTLNTMYMGLKFSVAGLKLGCGKWAAAIQTERGKPLARESRLGHRVFLCKIFLFISPFF